MKYNEMTDLLEDVIIPTIRSTRTDGQKEYARTSDDVLANFKRIGEAIELSHDKVIAVYLLKHLDGVMAYIDGHTSQREDVRGRLTDAITYLCILWASVEDNNQSQTKEVPNENNSHKQRKLGATLPN